MYDGCDIYANILLLSRVSVSMHTERDIVLPILSVCPSVCLSVCPVPTLGQMNGHNVTLFEALVGHHFLYFHRRYTKIQGNPSSGACITRGWENIENIAIYLGSGTR